ncbi:MAG: BlaI/MecI/CopY family transcriptional regulator [Candidatus Faecousia sp.]|nr:BlaI/MecI/CopY family transcriptional regulator [Candidatus Faecousia sp.]
MDDFRLGVVETRFAELIWAHEPLSSGELVKLCARELEWKKSTTYTVLKKLCDRGLFQNQDGIVTSIVSRQEFQSRQSRRFVEDTFSGSLPAFIAAFADGGNLTDRDISEIRKMIDAYGGGGKK